jgi:hypothetical protein
MLQNYILEESISNLGCPDLLAILGDDFCGVPDSIKMRAVIVS